MNENDNREMNPQPEASPQQDLPESPAPSPSTQPIPSDASASSPAQQDQPQPAPAWEKPTPQLTLDPDPTPPAVEFTTPEPPRAPEPPVEPQPTVQNQYVYNFNTPPTPEQGHGQNPGYSQPYSSGYQPPNYTAQSYRPQPPQQPKYTTPPVGYQQKSRLAAGLLAIILGSLGIHNFYLGFNARGTVQLVLCLAGGLLTCGLGSIAALVWGFIEGVMLLSSNNVRFDGNGVILRD